MRYVLLAALTDEADQMGVRIGPGADRPPSPASTAGSRHAGSWLRRVDLIILPIVFFVDILLFSQLLRPDVVTATERVAIVCYSAIGICLLLFRRLAPVIVFAAIWAHTVVALLFAESYFPVLLLLVALEAVAELRSIGTSLAAVGAAAVPTAMLVTAAARSASPTGTVSAAIGSALFYCAADLLAWGCGRWVRRQRRQLDTIQTQHTIEVQAQREVAENAVSAERLRIARELHDIVAHSVTIMVLHAAGAKRVVDSDPARAKESLTTIEQSGQQAMAELRRLLQLLRDDEARSSQTGTPLPGLAQLDQTIQSVRGSGVAVKVEVAGEPGRLDASTDLAAYRLVQEALTNVTKHSGGGASATVSLEWGDEKVTVAVEDDGAGVQPLASTMSTGNGLAGLRERVALAGGDFAAGPTEAGGFRVAARLPVSSIESRLAPVDRAGPEPAGAAPSGDRAVDPIQAEQCAVIDP